jgi:DNA-binding transcriptional ArsR family regulator
MSESTERVRRLLESELDECCEADVDRRLSELEELRAETRDAVRQDCDLLGTLGNETRFDLIRYLDASERAMCVCELEALMDVSESAVSHALSDLTDVGLVTREKRGKWRYYEVTERASAILSVLDETRPESAETGEPTGTER